MAIVRELRTTDIRCRECGAGPGERCKMPIDSHTSRVLEADKLAKAGWEWQEVDPRDKGAKGAG